MKMRKSVRTMVVMVLMAALLAGNSGFTSLAAEGVEQGAGWPAPEVLGAKPLEGVMPYTMLSECIISVSGDEEAMYIDIATGAVGMASVLGVKDIKIMRKVWYGWSTVAISNGGESYNHTMMGLTITYENAVKDATYRIVCTHYADVNGYEEGVNDTGAFVYTY